MSERGVFAVDRGIWDHDLLVEDAPFSRREAWLWIVSEAAWKPHRRRITGKLFELQRGQLVASLRFIAAKWRWSEARVRRFLHALNSERMIDAKSDAGVTVITVCKYDEYQRVSLPDDATRETDVDAGATQERRKVEDKEYKEDRGGSSAGELAAISKTAIDLAAQASRILGLDPAAWGPGWCGAALRLEAGLRDGWIAADVITGARMAAASLGQRGPPESFRYVEKVIARAFAERMAPIPLQKPGNRHAEKSRGPSSLTAAIDQHIERLGEPSHGEYGQDTARLLSHG